MNNNNTNPCAVAISSNLVATSTEFWTAAYAAGRTAEAHLAFLQNAELRSAQPANGNTDRLRRRYSKKLARTEKALERLLTEGPDRFDLPGQRDRMIAEDTARIAELKAKLAAL